MPRTDTFHSGATETLVASAARTASGDSGKLTGWGGAKSIRAQLDVTAASGTTPTLDAIIEDTIDGTNWFQVGAFVQKVTTGREAINITGLFSDVIRVRWTVAGTTPSFTFSVACYSE